MEKAAELKELIESKNFSKIKELLKNYLPADIVELMEELTHEEKIIVFRFLDKDNAAEVFAHLDESSQYELLSSFTEDKVKQIIEELSPDDRTELLDELPAGVVKKLLHHLSTEEREKAYMLLNYPEDSAGRLMTPEFVDLKERMTVDEAICHIRKVADMKETIYYGYVTDERRKLVGIVSLRKILMAKPEDRIGEIMDKNVIFVETTTDKEEVANTIKKYDFLALPVVDKEQRLVGIITHDDVMDIVEDETTEDIHKMAAMGTETISYLRSSILSLVRRRIVWLALILFAATFTANIIERYEATLSAAIALAFFIPVLMNTGGNTGLQSSTLVIRALATGEIELKDTFYIILREILIGILIGVSLGILGFIRALLVKDADPYFGLTIGVSLIAAVFCSNLMGASLPLIAKLVRIDPAFMTGPFITTLVDILTLIIYFNIARLLLLS